MDTLIQTLLEMTPEQIAAFVKARPYHARKVQLALRKLKALQAEREAAVERCALKGIDLNQYV